MNAELFSDICENIVSFMLLFFIFLSRFFFSFAIGNICRSTMAEALFREFVKQKGDNDKVSLCSTKMIISDCR